MKSSCASTVLRRCRRSSVLASSGAAQQASRVGTGRLQPPRVAPHRAGGQPHQRGRRRAGRSARLLRRLRVRRHLQDDRRRRHAGSRSSTISRCHSIGDIAVAPSDPSIVWAGTGEACIRSHISVGEGIFKSTDAGRTWTRMGLEKTGRIGRVVVHPQNPDVVLACALGHAYGPQPERGVFRTTDGGKTWERVLFVDENTGCSELDDGSEQPAQALRRACGSSTSRRGAARAAAPAAACSRRTTAARRGRGCAARGCRRARSARSRSRSRRRIPIASTRMIETGDGIPWKGKETDRGQVWRSEDGGANWRVVSYDRNAMGRAHYYSHIFVAPDNENETYFLTRQLQHVARRRPDARPAAGRARARAAIITTCGSIRRTRNRMIVGHDQGFSISHNRGQHVVSQPAAERADVPRDRRQPDSVLRLRQQAGRPVVSRPEQQPSGRVRRPAASSRAACGTPSPAARAAGPRPIPVDPNLIWSSASGSGSVGGIVAHLRREPAAGAQRRGVAGPGRTACPADLKYRFNWTMPLTMSPHDRNTVYVGSQHVHRTTNRGQSWEVISPDLSTNDKSASSSPAGSPATTSASSTRSP